MDVRTLRAPSSAESEKVVGNLGTTSSLDHVPPFFGQGIVKEDSLADHDVRIHINDSYEDDNVTEQQFHLHRPHLGVGLPLPISSFAKQQGGDVRDHHQTSKKDGEASDVSIHERLRASKERERPAIDGIDRDSPTKRRTGDIRVGRRGEKKIDAATNVSSTYNSTGSNGTPDVVSAHHDAILRRWRSQAFVYMQLQQNSSYFYRWVYNFLSYPVILFTVISSASIFSSRDDGLRYFAAALTITSSVLTTCIRQIRPAELSQEHATCSHRFRIILHSLDSCMKTPPPMRKDLSYFMDRVQTEIDRLITSQVDPPTFVIKRFESSNGPVNALLYGEDVISMVFNNMRTNDFVNDLHQQSKQTKRNSKSKNTDPPTTTKQSWKTIEKMLADTSGMDIKDKHMLPILHRALSVSNNNAGADPNNVLRELGHERPPYNSEEEITYREDINNARAK